MKKYIFIAATCLILGGLAFFGWKEATKPRYPAPETFTAPTNAPIQTCKSGDLKCLDSNEKVKAKKLTGSNVAYAKHQCDSPRGCDIPDESTINAAISAIHTYTKKPKLELIRITGINPAQIMYFCSNDNRCWGINTKDNTIYKALENDKANTPSTTSISPSI